MPASHCSFGLGNDGPKEVGMSFHSEFLIVRSVIEEDTLNRKQPKLTVTRGCKENFNTGLECLPYTPPLEKYQEDIC